MYSVFVASAWMTIQTVIRVETDATLNARFAGFMYILDAGMNLLMALYIREAGYIHGRARARINKCAKLFARYFGNKFDQESLLPLKYRAPAAYDLIAVHGKTSERIDETKRSDGMEMGTEERGRERGLRVDVAVGGKRAEG